MGGVGLAVALRHEVGNRPAEGLGRRQAEHAFRSRIEQHHQLLVIDGDDAVHGRGDNALQPLHGLQGVTR